ncbi:class I adenylate-forming enzyme family protein [Methanosarcina mazei]|uniref:Long-chain fatty acid--CoA ligase n=3 Tax=Methanosarcina mazei TaxID=2209 RepID=A0A0F8H6H9_METMZ|nr:class I adenylate-forming enzyme family protein [Methanosarcina mazei]AKB41534.1 Long-chain-fatty-acid--CoA ligase [Methanosarcina mazei WWM610]KKG72231.1 long-chain fatty acid--CoA ligase [Methanosarcina mazei]KKH62074.1 long-chain fatty acid--CoA ligase [Methanosarcina mazei]
MRIDAYITEYARKTPLNIALEEGKNSISYSCLEKDISDISLLLMDFKHCRFAILAESGIQYVKLLMAVYRSENIAIPLPIEFPKFSLEQILDSAHINNIITTDTQYSRYGESFFERFGTVVVVSGDTSVKILRKDIKAETNIPELRLVLYTSGTTGTPKGVMLSDKNLVANGESIIEVLNINSKDKGALVISPHHAFGNSIIDSHLMAGGSIRIGNMNFMNSVFNLIGSGVSIFYGVPSTYRMLLRYPDRFREAFSTVRTAASAGGGMDKAIVKEIRELAPGLGILPMYGQTEATARLAYVPAEDVDRFIDTIGKAIPGVTLEVFDSEHRPVEPNITGELVAGGENLLLGYLDDEIATENKIINGWLHTGDLARKLPNGYIQLLGRKDDLIKIGDHRVNPREIEKHIEENNRVSRVFVVPVPHEFMGTAISLMVIPTEETEIENLFAFCRKSLPGYLCPREILFIDHLPLSENGKISNRSIIEEYKHVKDSV